jgi:MFS family permease
MSSAAGRGSAFAGPQYKWTVVGLLWFCGFFNYADRQAVTSVFPRLQQEFGLTKTDLGMLGSAFMVVYALAAPLAGFVVDRASRRYLIVSGLGFWSLICAATGTARTFGQLLFYRAAEGLGESFYFPASMSLLADYHAPGTRSRAMSMHQTSVYLGTAGGGALAGFLAEWYGWRSPFWILGGIGFAFALVLGRLIIEPVRGKAEPSKPPVPIADELAPPGPPPNLVHNLAEIVRVPSACALMAAFAGANFVAMSMITWLPMFVFSKFPMGLARAALIANLFMQGASLVGALIGGALADRLSHRPGGRMTLQGVALLLGAPCAFAVGWTGQMAVLISALIAIGLCKGVYDANIFASVYDVVPTHVRGTAAGLMNTVGWTGGSLAPLAIGMAGDRYGLSVAIAWTAAVYVVASLFALFAASLARYDASVRPV